MNDSNPPQIGTGDTSVHKITLLVVEDDQGLNHLIQKLLRRHGFVSEGVMSGAEALRRITELDNPLLLLDYRLPDMTANQIIQNLAIQRPTVPFIVMTGNGDERIAVEMMKLGAHDYLIKSETFLDLLPTVVHQAIERIVTERRLQQAEHALREAERRFSLLFQRIGIGVGLSAHNGQILVANEAMQQVTGYSTAELAQIPLTALYTEPELRTVLTQQLRAAGSVHQAELMMRRKDGTIFQASCSFDQIEFEGQQAVLVAVEDITERIAARQRIKHLNAVLNGIRRVNHLIVEETEQDKLICGACESLIQTFGYTTAWIIRLDEQRQVIASASAGFADSTSPLEAMPAHNGLPLCACKAIEQSGAIASHGAHTCAECPIRPNCTSEARMTIRLEYNNKIYGALSVGLAPGFIEDQEEQQLFAEVARDLAFALYKIEIEAERVRTEAELKASRIDLRRALDDLELRVAERTNELSVANINLARALRVKDEFLANMSHELRTPLTAILGRTEMCREGIYGALMPTQSEALRSIEESGRHLLELINDVLDVAKIEAGRVDLDIELIQVSTVCAASVRLVSQQALKKRLQISQQIDPEVRLLYADGRRIKQILVNLLSNAVKFTPEGGQIGLEVAGDRANEIICFSIWDTGIGIAAEHLGRLFQPFVQVDSSLSRAHEGTGLGLNLVLSLAQLHGGGVSVETESGRGSRFTVTLPWRQPASEEAPPEEQPAEGDTTAAHVISGRSDAPLILLAEDNEEMIDLMGSYLTINGMRLAVAHNGAEAVRLASATRPDLILMDVQMPQMDGLFATRQIRAIPALHTVPIIALTALVMPGDRERCLEAGASEYLSKPVGMRRLLQIINTFIAADQSSA